MNALEQAVTEALQSAGANKEANKAYLEFIKANFFIPVEKISGDEPAMVLFLQENDRIFLPVFSNKQYLDEWAIDIQNEIDLLTLSGVDLLKGIGEEITVAFNIGTPFYKEFNAAEIARMRSMVLKLFK